MLDKKFNTNCISIIFNDFKKLKYLEIKFLKVNLIKNHYNQMIYLTIIILATKLDPCLWLGMSTGVVVAFNLMLPMDRIISNVVVAPSG